MNLIKTARLMLMSLVLLQAVPSLSMVHKPRSRNASTSTRTQTQQPVQPLIPEEEQKRAAEEKLAAAEREAKQAADEKAAAEAKEQEEKEQKELKEREEAEAEQKRREENESPLFKHVRGLARTVTDTMSDFKEACLPAPGLEKDVAKTAEDAVAVKQSLDESISTVKKVLLGTGATIAGGLGIAAAASQDGLVKTTAGYADSFFKFNKEYSYVPSIALGVLGLGLAWSLKNIVYNGAQALCTATIDPEKQKQPIKYHQLYESQKRVVDEALKTQYAQSNPKPDITETMRDNKASELFERCDTSFTCLNGIRKKAVASKPATTKTQTVSNGRRVNGGRTTGAVRRRK